jgi:hypothetical protein
VLHTLPTSALTLISQIPELDSSRKICRFRETLLHLQVKNNRKIGVNVNCTSNHTNLEFSEMCQADSELQEEECAEKQIYYFKLKTMNSADINGRPKMKIIVHCTIKSIQ